MSLVAAQASVRWATLCHHLCLVVAVVLLRLGVVMLATAVAVAVAAVAVAVGDAALACY